MTQGIVRELIRHILREEAEVAAPADAEKAVTASEDDEVVNKIVRGDDVISVVKAKVRISTTGRSITDIMTSMRALVRVITVQQPDKSAPAVDGKTELNLNIRFLNNGKRSEDGLKRLMSRKGGFKSISEIDMITVSEYDSEQVKRIF